MLDTKKNKTPLYSSYKLYFGKVNGHDSIIYEFIKNHVFLYKELINLETYEIVDEFIYNDFVIKKTLKEEMDNKKICSCLVTDGKDKIELTIDEILNVIKLIKLLESKSFDNLDDLCFNVSSDISNLLGININSNPSSKLKVRNVDEILVTAPVAIKFKMFLSNYIKLSLILFGNISIKNDDFRIKKAFEICKIKNTNNNQFMVVIDSNSYSINCLNIENGFQKTFSNKKK